jgi:hypothetical protein
VPKLIFHHFDEKAQVHITTATVTAAELAASSCWLPARFLGGPCDHYFHCQEAQEANCQAGPSRLARHRLEDTVASGDTGNIREDCREDRVCAICETVILDEVYLGEAKTAYEGKPICEGCFDTDLDEPCATVYLGSDDEEPKLIGSCRNETDGDFSVRWHRTDPWRGYYELLSDTYTELFTDAILSWHESEEMLKKLYDRLLARLEAEDIGFARAFARSSNVFMTCLEIWIEKDLEKMLKAQIILSQIKDEVDFDNELFKTGILIPRDSLQQFKTLMGDKYKITTDSYLAELVASKGDDLLPEIMAATANGGKGNG